MRRCFELRSGESLTFADGTVVFAIDGFTKRYIGSPGEAVLAPDDDHPADRAAKILGSQTALAAALGVNKTAVSQWKEEGRRVPAEHCPLIERMTKGQVRCEDLRPDMAWDVLRSPVASAEGVA